MATVVGLFVSPDRGSGRSEPRERVTATASHGFEGCAHANPPRREVLLVSKQHLDAVGVEPGAIRENVTVEGVDVEAWTVGQRVKVGAALVEITMVCDPCHKMDRLREGLRAELEGRRGMLAHVVEGGEIALGDPVEPVAGSGSLS
jgi:MOSC domain-containing protein YiiM